MHPERESFNAGSALALAALALIDDHALVRTGLPESANAGDQEGDPLYDETVRIVTDTRRPSVSGVQRRLKIGCNRAARLVEAMEAAGTVTAPEHNGHRGVLAPPPRN